MFKQFTLAFTCIIFFVGISIAAEFDPEKLQQRILQTIEHVKPAVVSIGTRGASFSGVIVSPDGHVLSAGHTVQPGNRYRVRLPDGRVLYGKGLITP